MRERLNIQTKRKVTPRRENLTGVSGFPGNGSENAPKTLAEWFEGEIPRLPEESGGVSGFPGHGSEVQHTGGVSGFPGHSVGSTSRKAPKI